MKILKSLSCLSLIWGLLVFMTGCPQSAVKTEPLGKVYFTYFDTVSYIYNYAGGSTEDFDAVCEGTTKILEEYHNLFDIYYEHSGVTNLRTINLNAGGEPLKVDQKLIDFLLYAKELYALTGGEDAAITKTGEYNVQLEAVSGAYSYWSNMLVEVGTYNINQGEIYSFDNRIARFPYN